MNIDVKTHDITVSRTIRATPAEIYDVWLDPKSPGGPWFGAERAMVQPHVDGFFYLSMGHEGRTYPHYGRFIRLDRGERIEHTWMSPATRGLETTVTITLRATGDTTEMTLVHTGVPDDDVGRGHRDGWVFIVGSLAGKLEARHKTK